MHELIGANKGVWRKSCYIDEQQYFTIESNRNIHFYGNSLSFNGNGISLNGHTHDDRYYTESEVNNLLGGKVNTSGGSISWLSVSGNLAFSGTLYSTGTNSIRCRHVDGTTESNMDGCLYLNYGNADKNVYFGNAGYCIYNNGANYSGVAEQSNWLRTSSHQDHLFHTEWDGGYFWTYVTAGDGGYRAVRVERSNSSGYADYSARSANDSGFYISGYYIYVG